MLSRTADSIYWLNRYIERAENYARFLDVNMQLALDFAEGAQWMPLVETTGDREQFLEAYGEANADNVIRFLISDEKNPNSILSCVSIARENARAVREMISTEMWLHINRFYLTLTESAAPGIQVANYSEFLAWVKDNCALHAGLMDGSLSHTEAWHFGKLGRSVERADKTSRLLDIKYFYLLPGAEQVGSEADLIQWQAVLRSASALEMFRREYNRLTPANVAGFLILDRHFPRSIRFCITEGERSLRELTGGDPQAFRNEAEKRMGSFRSQLEYTEVGDIFRHGLHEYLDLIELRLNEIGEAIQEVFLVPPDTSSMPAGAVFPQAQQQA
ncbi:MAG TPA: alpha-E domain-containing protein [Leptospiraceae bacterium]|nr:alpha-E domain-containing protein [Leptospirales bacterium]HMX55242.1 alpha-E domain-containing protein [Leptospiraceae bacterium]HMY43981.1 alpha-E domain-containing protein [Leptospiraceae bacterium]HNE24914.1 alpha-E domain-containing protein [Leptospiraceae bacterium]HNJ05624.1 alpha-E domain-containing protein [Leptospiraceae bacterium]